MLLPFLYLFSSLALTPDAASERYLDCLLLIETDVETGRRAAQIWAQEGGGVPAEHCLALADIAAGFEKLGAARLERVAEHPLAGDNLARARLYAQAADAWLDADEKDFAADAIKAAFEQAPAADELHLTAAKVHAAFERWQQVIAAVSTAEQAGLATADAYVWRGRANLALGATEAAAHDVVAALTLDARNIDALTLRGDVQRAGVAIDVAIGGGP